jgi:hypothetical protein
MRLLRNCRAARLVVCRPVMKKPSPAKPKKPAVKVADLKPTKDAKGGNVRQSSSSNINRTGIGQGDGG